MQIGDLVKHNNQLKLIIGIIVGVHDGLTSGDKGYHTVLIDGEQYSIAAKELELINASR